MQPIPKLILPETYVREATESARKAKQRISVLTLILTDDEATNEFIDALCEAADRGVQVSVGADAFTYTELRGSYIPTTYRSKRMREATTLQKRFKKAGVDFTWLGRLSAVAFSGRTHIKWCIVDDTVYSFGGVNLNSESFTYTDYMFAVTNPDLADRLAAEHDRIIRADKRGHTYRSLRFGDDDNTVLIDGGFFGDSIIYRRACHFAEQATHVTLVSQYYPSGKLGRLLKSTEADIYCNRASNSGLFNKVIIDFGARWLGQISKYKREPYLHAKFIIFTLKNGQKVAITGSHNFVRAGVFLGTREVALETTNKKIIRQLERFLKDYVK
jgi:cardiolipin synthase